MECLRKGVCYIAICLFIYFEFTIGISVPITFPELISVKLGDRCQHFSGNPGKCQKLSYCPEIARSIRKGEVTYKQVACNGDRSLRLVCCRKKQPILDISKPEGTEACGKVWLDDGSADLSSIYIGNQTAESFEEMGYTIDILDMFFDDILSFSYTKGTEKGIWQRKFPFEIEVAGGINARRQLTGYMALIGDNERWLCDGVLIHSQWVLTAAHCFGTDLLSSSATVRLGEYDFSDNTVTRKEFPLDFKIERILKYPHYRYPSVYHDIALIKLAKPIPFLRPDIKPICLPWGEESETDLIGQVVTLTGWGATIFTGPSSPILQEVNVTVMDSAVCDRSYSTLHDYRSRFPNGIDRGTSICAGDIEGGKDACQGDSGGPIVYLNNEGRYTLAGIVSTGNGCGLKEFPGIYVPLHNPEYLAWIKFIVYEVS